MKKTLILFLLILLLTNTHFFASNSIINVEVVGLGGIADGNIETAREKAIENALRLSIEQAVGTLISQESLVRNGTLIEDSIFKKSNGFVESFDVINEQLDVENELFWITLNVNVMIADIQQSLRDILESIETINTFLFLEGDETFRLMLINDLSRNGIEVIDYEQLETIKDKNRMVMLKDNIEDIDEASFWGLSRSVCKKRKIKLKT